MYKAREERLRSFFLGISCVKCWLLIIQKQIFSGENRRKRKIVGSIFLSVGSGFDGSKSVGGNFRVPPLSRPFFKSLFFHSFSPRVRRSSNAKAMQNTGSRAQPPPNSSSFLRPVSSRSTRFFP